MAIAELSTRARIDAHAARYFPGAARAVHDGRARYGQRVSGATMVAEFMKLVGIEVVFGIPGGASLPLNDGLTVGHDEGAFRYVLTGHEQGAAFEAEGYAAATGRAGFCTGTSGPGATNLVTGLADAFRDSRPVFAVTGNTATTAEPEAFQAIDIVGITDGKATKLSLRPTCADDVPAALVRAYHACVTGRPGAVLVDLPKDVQAGQAELRPWEDLLARYDWAPPAGDGAALDEVARMLATAERPLLYVGNGVTLSDAARELRALSRLLDVPVATTVHALGVLPADDPRSLGMLGMHGQMVANLAAYLADVVVVIGARFDDRVVGGQPQRFAPNARVVHVDADRRQLNRVRTVDLAIHADAKLALARLLEAAVVQPRPDRGAWLAQLDEIRQAMPIQSDHAPESAQLSHELVYAEIAAALRELDPIDLVATFDVGTHQMKGAQWFPVSYPRSFLTSGGMGSMGCALPLAVGAAFARPDATVIAAVGDGGFVMSSHELDTIGGYRVPVKIVLFDDSSLGMVHNWHGLFFEGRNLTSDRRRGRERAPRDLAAVKATLQEAIARAQSLDDVVATLAAATAELAEGEWPAFALTAAAYGIPGERVHTRAQFAAAIRRALATDGPYLLHVVLPARAQVYPLMQPGTTPQDIIWRESAPGSGVPVYARERFDYEAGRLRPVEPPPPRGHPAPAPPSADGSAF